MALMVKSMEPAPSWGSLVPFDLLQSQAYSGSLSAICSRTYSDAPELPNFADLYGLDACQRPTASMPPSSGALGPGEYTFNEGQTRPNPVCRSWGKSERFAKIVKEPPLPDDPSIRKDPHSPSRPQDQDKRPVVQSMKPIRDTRIKLGRASSTPSLPTIRDAYKFTTNARVMVGAKPLQKRLNAGDGRHLITTPIEEYTVPGRMGKSEGKLFLRSEFPRPNAGVSSILGVQTEATYRLFVGGGTKKKPM